MKLLLSVLFSFFCMALSAQDYRVVNNEVKILRAILFKENTAVLLPADKESLAFIKKYLDDKTYISELRIESNVNIFDDASKDQRLSEERAKAVYAMLVSMGADCKRLIVTAFGNTKPVADPTGTGQAANTNVRFVNVSIKGHLIGGIPADGGGKLIPVVCK